MTQEVLQVREPVVQEEFGGRSWPEVCDALEAQEVPELLEGFREALTEMNGGAWSVVIADRLCPWCFAFNLVYPPGGPKAEVGSWGRAIEEAE